MVMDTLKLEFSLFLSTKKRKVEPEIFFLKLSNTNNRFLNYKNINFKINKKQMFSFIDANRLS